LNALGVGAGASRRRGGVPLDSGVHRRAIARSTANRVGLVARALSPRHAAAADDIHLLAGRSGRRGAFNLFNLLQTRERQARLHRAGHPTRCPGQARVVSRLEGGLVAELKEPDRSGKADRARAAPCGQNVSAEPALLITWPIAPPTRCARWSAWAQRVSARVAEEVPSPPWLGARCWKGSRPRGAAASASAPADVVSSLGGIKSARNGVGLARSHRSPDRGAALMAIKGSLKEASLPTCSSCSRWARRPGACRSRRSTSATSTSKKAASATPRSSTRRDRLGNPGEARKINRRSARGRVHKQSTARGKKLGEILVGMGAISQADLERYMRVQIEESVYYLFTWTQGTFTSRSTSGRIRAGLPRVDQPRSLLLEAPAGWDEWEPDREEDPLVRI